ncbi:MAG: ATP-binding protein [Halopenitus sp.]
MSDSGSGSRTEAGDPASPSRELRQYETIVQVLPDPVYVSNAEGYLTFANRAFEEQFGYEVTDEKLHFSEFIVDEDVEKIRTLLRDLAAEGDDGTLQSRTVSLEGVAADGGIISLEGSIGILFHDGRFEGAAGVLRDVTAQRRRDEVFDVMDRALRHNLRTNVNLITGYADLLEPAIGPDNEEHLSQIQDAATWLGKFGDSLRALQSAIEKSHQGSGTISLERVVKEAVGDVADAYPQANVEAHLSTTRHIQGGQPVIDAVENVVENGVVHNDSDPPVVNVWVTHATRDGWAEIHVEDNGPGIPDDEREIVLGEADITALQHGSGIGLWITRWVVQLIDGEIEIEAADGEGTVVTFVLPLAEDTTNPA